MYESSLSEELSVFDFTGAGNASFNRSVSASGSFSSSQQSEQQFRRFLHAHDGTSGSDTEGHHSQQDSLIELELDDLNEHECMEAFVSLLHSLVTNNITPVYERGHEPKEMPPWMEFLHRKVTFFSDNSFL